jgi:O-antigen ligase
VFAHNSYLQVWSESGIVAVAGLCIFVQQLVRSRTRDGIYFGLIGFLIDNLFSFTLLRPTTSIFFWAMLAIYCAKNKETL